ncbi:MAG: hypothetical protein M1822_005308 [Bathelium mastoideum]|nr:MAG: hypothetical protein M1822_005308 [Bathelium mastoideum]
MASPYIRPDEMLQIDDDMSMAIHIDMNGECEEDDRALALATEASEKSFQAEKSASSGTRKYPRPAARASSTELKLLVSCETAYSERISAGDTVEVHYGIDASIAGDILPFQDFLRTAGIYLDLSRNVTILKGTLFRRNRSMKGMLPFKKNEVLNEVCMLLPPGDMKPSPQPGFGKLRPKIEDRMTLITLDQAGKKRDLYLTNLAFPSLSFRTRVEAKGQSKEKVFHHFNLVCRWSYTGPDPFFDKPDMHCERVLAPLMKETCPAVRLPGDHFIDAAEIRSLALRETPKWNNTDNIIEQWRNGVAKLRPEEQDEIIDGTCLDKAIDLDMDDEDVGPSGSTLQDAIDVDAVSNPTLLAAHSLMRHTPHQSTKEKQNSSVTTNQQRLKRSFGDLFSGGGGASMSAQLAGLQPCLAVDQAFDCMITYRKNFPAVQIYTEELHDFLRKRASEWVGIEILHISPPCQPFSPAKTRDGKNDDENIAAFFAVFSLLETIRPRIVTLEQTYGVLTRHGQIYFHALLGMFSSRGYSVRTKVIHHADYGSEEGRMRLIILAARDGEELPKFLPPTHNKHGANGLPRWRTARDFLNTIKNLPLGPLHQPHQMHKPNLSPTSLDGQMKTVVTKGKVIHPLGKRYLTILELAILQGFPVDYKWADPMITATQIRAQIGNAVVPTVFSLQLRHLREQLEKVDDEREPVDGPFIVDLE